MRLHLTSEEGFVFSRLDGHTDLKNLCQLTGFDSARIHTIVNRLLDEGALLSDSMPSSFERVHVPRPPLSQEGAPQGDPSSDSSGQKSGPPSENPDDDFDDDDFDDDDFDDDDFDDDDFDDDDFDDDDDDSVDPAKETDGQQDVVHSKDGKTIDLTKLYKSDFSKLPVEQRAELAAKEKHIRLMALCLDPDRSVCRALFKNPHFEMAQARVYAKHQRSVTNLGLLVRRSRYLRDLQVQTQLFRNPQMSESMVRRVIKMKRLAQLYRIAVSQEATERVRQSAKAMLRARFQHGSPEERITLFFKTEGRCLPMIAGLGIDGRTAQLMCTRTYHSRILVQNLAKWPPLPPRVITHLVKQPAVRRQATLRNALLSHPNASRQLKAQFKGKRH